jgi:threonine synthase
VRSRVPWLEGTWLKFEGAHPSGSFKERVMETLVREAVAAAALGAVVASSGNAAVAASTHAARHGLPLLVVVPETVPPAIERMVTLRGAGLVHVGDGPAAAHHAAKRLADRFGLPNLASTFAASGCEWACRGIGHEIVDQLGGRSPALSTVAAAVSVGPVLVGTATGLRERGVQVRMVAGQAAGCAPIARAFAQGADEVVPWTGDVATRATSIADRLTGYAREGTSFLRAVREGDGLVVAVDDRELADVRADLGRYDGLDVELSSCAAVAALRAAGRIGEDTVAVLTGAGLRETLAAAAGPAPARRAVLGAFLDRVTGGDADVEEVDRWILSGS